MASIFQARKGGGWTTQINVGGNRRPKTFPKKQMRRVGLDSHRLLSTREPV